MTGLVAGAVLTMGLLGAVGWMCCRGPSVSRRGRGARFHRAKSTEIDLDDDDDEFEDAEEGEEEQSGREKNAHPLSSALARLSNGGKRADGGAIHHPAATTKVAPKVPYRTKGKAIKVFIEVDGAVHILRISMQPVEVRAARV